jgi:hypothetical protein
MHQWDALDAIERARGFALARHATQVDKAGRPYFEHVDRVAKAVAQFSSSAHAVITAYLHDVVEDGHATPEEIEEHFGRAVRVSVGLLTRQPDNTYFEYISLIETIGTYDERLIKLMDLDDHLRPASPYRLPASLRQRYEAAITILKGA